jgi:Fe-S cluster assembly protein SufB
MEWIDGNIGSKVTMKYPAVYLMGEHANGETLSVAFAGEGQHQDAGAKMVHAAPRTTSNIVSKSVARGGGRTSYRGLVQVQEGATGSRATSSATRCWSTRSAGPTPTRTSTCARTTCPSATRRPSPRSARTSSST